MTVQGNAVACLDPFFIIVSIYVRNRLKNYILKIFLFWILTAKVVKLNTWCTFARALLGDLAASRCFLKILKMNG